LALDAAPISPSRQWKNKGSGRFHRPIAPTPNGPSVLQADHGIRADLNEGKSFIASCKRPKKGIECWAMAKMTRNTAHARRSGAEVLNPFAE
jgi:hypothetical protein